MYCITNSEGLGRTSRLTTLYLSRFAQGRLDFAARAKSVTCTVSIQGYIHTITPRMLTFVVGSCVADYNSGLANVCTSLLVRTEGQQPRPHLQAAGLRAGRDLLTQSVTIGRVHEDCTGPDIFPSPVSVSCRALRHL